MLCRRSYKQAGALSWRGSSSSLIYNFGIAIGLGGEHNDVDFGAGDPKRRNEVFRMEAGGMPDTKPT